MQINIWHKVTLGNRGGHTWEIGTCACKEKRERNSDKKKQRTKSGPLAYRRGGGGGAQHARASGNRHANKKEKGQNKKPKRNT